MFMLFFGVGSTRPSRVRGAAFEVEGRAWGADFPYPSGLQAALFEVGDRLDVELTHVEAGDILAA